MIWKIRLSHSDRLSKWLSSEAVEDTRSGGRARREGSGVPEGGAGGGRKVQREASVEVGIKGEVELG